MYNHACTMYVLSLHVTRQYNIIIIHVLLLTVYRAQVQLEMGFNWNQHLPPPIRKVDVATAIG